MRKILFVTGSRADYGLLKNLILKCQSDSEIETHTIATGSHLSSVHGRTIEILKADGIKNITEVDLKIHGDRPEDICDAIATGHSGFVRAYQKIKPDLIVVLGDRYELICACIPAVILNIPIAHLHGGESTEGAIDESIRHAVTKMSHLHFCSHPQYQKRIISMGENPGNVFMVGAIGLDRIKEIKFLSKDELESKLNIKFGTKNILCTFHPVTTDEKESNKEIDNLILAIEEVISTSDVKILITLPNADTFSSYIRTKWETFIKGNQNKVYSFTNLGDLLYLSTMSAVDLILGNSSSGIIEAPFLNKAVIDIGTRQLGRLKSSHILSSNGEKEDLIKKIEKALSTDFTSALNSSFSIYGNGETCNKIFKVIQNADLNKLKSKKFYDDQRL